MSIAAPGSRLAASIVNRIEPSAVPAMLPIVKPASPAVLQLPSGAPPAQLAPAIAGFSNSPLRVGATAANSPSPVVTGRAAKTIERSEVLKDIPTPTQIVAHLDQYVWGQSAAKIVIANGVYEHLARLAIIEHCYRTKSALPDDLDDKNNIMLVGPTGVGKTLIVATLAKMLDVPFAHIDATTLTESGYVGEDIESMLHKLIQAAGGNTRVAERGILFIDEIDKKRKPEGENMSITRDVSGLGVQQAMLRMAEGGIVRVPKEGGRHNPSMQMLEIDTTNILFITGGAFTGIDKVVSGGGGVAPDAPYQTSNMGFRGRVAGDAPAAQTGSVYERVDAEDLVKFGMLSEFMGRFPVIAGLAPLSVDDLRRIITEPKNAIGKQYAQKFAREGVALEITDAGLTALAQRGFDKGIGGRGLKTIFANVFGKTLFELPGRTDVAACKLDGDLVPQLLTTR